MKRSKTRSLLCVIVMLVALLTACQTGLPAVQDSTSATATPAPGVEASMDTGADSPFGKYDPAITLSTIREVDTTLSYMPGETWDNNLWTQAYEEYLGIKFTYTWTCSPDEYDNKVNIAIASDDLPDYFSCSYDQFYRLANAGKLADLTSAIDELGSEAMKICFDANDGLLRKQVTVDGKIQALGTATDLTGAGDMLWYRDDWAAEVGVAQPTTTEDVWNMATLFATNDPNGDGTPTVGFGISQGLWDNGMGLEGWFAMDGAYPTIWVQDGDELVFGAVQDVIKVTLKKLQDAYAEGLIDKDFINKGDWAEAPDDIVKNKIGLVIGPIWFGDWKCKDVMQAEGDNTATWTCMPVPDTKTPFSTTQDSVTVVNASCEYPEAVVKLSNLTGELTVGETAEGKYHDQVDPDGNTVDNFFHCLCVGYNVIISWDLECAKKVTLALQSGDTSDLNDEQMSYYDRCKAYVDWEVGDPVDGLLGYTSFSIFGPTGSEFVGEKMDQEGLQLMDAYYGTNTDTMNENWGNLMSKRDELFTAIIMGRDVDEGFEEWTNFWSTMQGDTITEEVNAWADSNK